MGYASHLNQHVKLRQNTKFQIYVLHSLKDMEEDQKRTGYRYPSLKIVFGGIFQVGSVSHLNQHVKLCTCTKFHACIKKCTIRPFFEVKRLHYEENLSSVQSKQNPPDYAWAYLCGHFF